MTISRHEFGFNRIHRKPVVTQSSVNSSTQEQDEAAKRLTWIGLWSDVGLFSLKTGVGVLSGSAALLADALHSGSDLVGGVIALTSLKLSRKPPDKKHPYGYGHYETLGTLGVSGILFIGSAMSIYYSLSHLVMAHFFVELDEGHHVVAHVPEAIGCCIVAMVVKEVLFQRTKKEGSLQNSPVLIANAWHHRSDAISSLAALTGIGAFALGFPIIDPIVGAVVGGLVMRTGAQLASEAVYDLTDRQRSTDLLLIATAEQVGKELNQRTGGEIRDVHNVRVRRLGNYLLMDAHVMVDPKLSVSAAYQASARVRQELLERVSGIRDVSVKVQSHPPRYAVENDPGYSFSEPWSEDDDLVDINQDNSDRMRNKRALKPLISFEGHVKDLRTRSQREIEKDIREAVSELPRILSVTHCSVHYNFSEMNQETEKRRLELQVEVNVAMDPDLSLGEAKEAAREAKYRILTVPDIHDVDIHIETF